MSLAAVSLSFGKMTWFAGALSVATPVALSDETASKTFDPERAETLSAVAVRALFVDKTWQWGDGAGYFRQDGKFFGWAEGAYATGRWEVSRSGNLCFYSVWYSRSGRKRKENCFFHRLFEGTIYQLVAGQSNWYPFKVKDTDQPDEYSNVKSGDLVKEKLAENKFDIEQYLSEKKKKR